MSETKEAIHKLAREMMIQNACATYTDLVVTDELYTADWFIGRAEEFYAALGTYRSENL